MSNLREKQKKEIKNRILEAAKEIFLEKGYFGTTMGDISKKVNIGVGTIYYYFKGKAELFLQGYFMEINKNIKTFSDEEIEADISKENLRKYTLYSINCYMDILSKLSKDILKDVNIQLLKNSNIKFNIESIYDEEENQIKKVLKIYKENDFFIDDFDIDEAYECLFSIVRFQLEKYTYEEKITIQDFKTNIERQTKFIFKGKYK